MRRFARAIVRAGGEREQKTYGKGEAKGWPKADSAIKFLESQTFSSLDNGWLLLLATWKLIFKRAGTPSPGPN